MKYASLFKNINEITVDDFDKEVLDQYGTLCVLSSSETGGTMVSYERTSDGEVVITSLDDLKREWQEKEVELLLDELSDRVADKVVEKIEEKKRQQETDYIAVLLQQRQPERVDCDELPEKGERDKMYCLNGEEWLWHNDNWVQIG